ncbi:expressed unknown protein [Seminavis robusta]|uniref:4-hydroxyphenylpyruvate dioxygenase n=1 Tax=Seminavis robusta TaxID=568900 RepID=A0A9N8H7G4_9STRA|nr:expressed unknown protein [Seminavis robusta]|eukprot:Sro178_g078150.1 n/a (689) ;mRNA; f:40290-42955
MQNKEEKRPQVSFSHVHLYVDDLKDLEVYKDLENRLNGFVKGCKEPLGQDIPTQRSDWKALQPDHFSSDKPTAFVPQNRDLVQQLLSGFGFRVTGARYATNDACNTRSVLITSKDPSGVQFLLTAKDPAAESKEHDSYHHFDADCLDRFYQCHADRPGIAVLAFLVEDVDLIHQRYQKLHPNLVVGMWDYPQDHVKILEVYAYYGKDLESKQADKGTILRFVQDNRQGANEQAGKICPVPGLSQVDAKFDDFTQPAYCDHWVSNVFHRREFLDTLLDTLDFTPKVDFNAGVVAAGEAQIESTVTGNDAATLVDNLSKEEALRDQSQVYLPINNALSQVGHVHGFLEELGQGIQHIASRVDDLVAFVQRANDSRKITGEGFTFLRIPRSYYGVVTIPFLISQVGSTQSSGEGGNPGLSEDSARAIQEACIKSDVTSKDGAVDLELTRQEISDRLSKNMAEEYSNDFNIQKDAVLDAILHSRYSNLYSLLRHHVTEETYLGIVRNQILVDVQGDDLLYQIFTSNVLQRNPGDEAPFLEFIQRVCSVCTEENGCAQKVKPGCGGFGIRNFLTLFLSIEVSKAMQEVSEAMEAGDLARQQYAEQMVDAFTRQLNEANPILTAISDAMTDEGRILEAVEKAVASQAPDDEIAALQARMEEAGKRKQAGNDALMVCSARYNELMKSLREERASK